MNERSSLPPTEVTAASIEQLSLSQQFDSTERVHRLHHYRQCDNKLAAGVIMQELGFLRFRIYAVQSWTYVLAPHGGASFPTRVPAPGIERLTAVYCGI